MTEEENEGILGYVELPKGVRKPIKIMNDMFINYAFENKENWEMLRLIANIFYEDYKNKVPNTTVELIKGEIKVKTQYKHFKNLSSVKAQDLEVESEEKTDFIEVQIKTNIELPIENRSMDYLGLSISRGKKNKSVQHLWLLADDLPNKYVLGGKEYDNYAMLSEKDYRPHPNNAGIMYVNLKELSKQDTKAGELANAILGGVKEPKYKEVKQILDGVINVFSEFKLDKEVKNMMTMRDYIREEGKAEGREEGKAEGKVEGVDELIELVSKGYSLGEAAEMVKGLCR